MSDPLHFQNHWIIRVHGLNPPNYEVKLNPDSILSMVKICGYSMDWLSDRNPKYKYDTEKRQKAVVVTSSVVTYLYLFCLLNSKCNCISLPNNSTLHPCHICLLNSSVNWINKLFELNIWYTYTLNRLNPLHRVHHPPSNSRKYINSRCLCYYQTPEVHVLTCFFRSVWNDWI